MFYVFYYPCVLFLNTTKQIKRMVAVMKEVYGVSAFNKKDTVQWDVAADRCRYVLTPEQGVNECAFYMMKMALVYDGIKITEQIKNKDVSFYIFSWNTATFFCFWYCLNSTRFLSTYLFFFGFIFLKSGTCWRLEGWIHVPALVPHEQWTRSIRLAKCSTETCCWIGTSLNHPLATVNQFVRVVARCIVVLWKHVVHWIWFVLLTFLLFRCITIYYWYFVEVPDLWTIFVVCLVFVVSSSNMFVLWKLTSKVSGT